MKKGRITLGLLNNGFANGTTQGRGSASFVRAG